MATLTVEIDKEKDLPAIQAFLNQMGLTFEVEDNEEEDWGDLPEAAIEGIKAGLEDIEAGRVHTHEEVRAYMKKRMQELSGPVK